MPEPCQVTTASLAPLLRDFVDRWNRDRPSLPPRNDVPDEVRTMSAVEWLEQETSIPRDSINKLICARRPTTTLSIADALLTAIGRPDALNDVEVVPHPSTLTVARVPPVGQGASLALAGRRVGLVLRSGPASFQAYVTAPEFRVRHRSLVASASSLHDLRRQLRATVLASEAASAYCCGGSTPDSLTGSF